MIARADAEHRPRTVAALQQVYAQDLATQAEGIDDADRRQRLLARRVSLRALRSAASPRCAAGFMSPLLVLMSMMGLLLLITCANTANLLRVDRARRGKYFDNPSPVTARRSARSPARPRRRGVGPRRRACGQGRLGQDLARRARRTSSTRSPIAWRRISRRSPSPRPGTTASRSARRPPPTCRSPSTISAISPVHPRPGGRYQRDRRRYRRLSLP